MSPDCLDSVKCSIFTWQYPVGKNQHCKIQILAEQNPWIDFLWLPWLAVLFVGAYASLMTTTTIMMGTELAAQVDVQIPSNRLPETYSLVLYWNWTSMLWSIALTSIIRSYRWLRSTAQQGHINFWSKLLTKCWFFY